MLELIKVLTDELAKDIEWFSVERWIEIEM